MPLIGPTSARMGGTTVSPMPTFFTLPCRNGIWCTRLDKRGQRSPSRNPPGRSAIVIDQSTIGETRICVNVLDDSRDPSPRRRTNRLLQGMAATHRSSASNTTALPSDLWEIEMAKVATWLGKRKHGSPFDKALASKIRRSSGSPFLRTGFPSEKFFSPQQPHTEVSKAAMPFAK